VDIGDLNQRIQIQTRDAGLDAAGQQAQTWATTYTVWAWIKGASGMASARQYEPQDGVAVALNTYSFRIRHLSAVTAGMRIVFNSVNYDIKQVRHDLAGKEWTDLVAEVGGNDG